jgi:hypothetical protein
MFAEFLFCYVLMSEIPKELKLKHNEQVVLVNIIKYLGPIEKRWKEFTECPYYSYFSTYINSELMKWNIKFNDNKKKPFYNFDLDKVKYKINHEKILNPQKNIAPFFNPKYMDEWNRDKVFCIFIII